MPYTPLATWHSNGIYLPYIATERVLSMLESVFKGPSSNRTLPFKGPYNWLQQL